VSSCDRETAKDEDRAELPCDMAHHVQASAAVMLCDRHTSLQVCHLLVILE
jgi:hypothetical protein